MPAGRHIHLLWQIQPGHKRENVQRDFLKYTAQKIKQDLEKYHPQVLKSFFVNAKDRKFQIWERNPLSIDLCALPENYVWSSALFYHTEKDNFGWLTHIMD